MFCDNIYTLLIIKKTMTLILAKKLKDKMIIAGDWLVTCWSDIEKIDVKKYDLYWDVYIWVAGITITQEILKENKELITDMIKELSPQSIRKVNLFLREELEKFNRIDENWKIDNNLLFVNKEKIFLALWTGDVFEKKQASIWAGTDYALWILNMYDIQTEEEIKKLFKTVFGLNNNCGWEIFIDYL